MLFFLPSLKADYWEQLFFEDVDDKTPTSVDINFLYKSESTTITSRLLWDFPQIPQARHGHSLPCIKYCFHGPDQKILTDAGRGKACLIVKGEHGVHKVS